MKILLELAGGVVIGVLAAVVLMVLDVELTPMQTAIIIGSIVIITTTVHGITAAIGKKIDEKNHKA